MPSTILSAVGVNALRYGAPPVSVTASSVRALTLGGPAAGDVILSILWSVGIIAVFGTLSVWLYRRAV